VLENPSHFKHVRHPAPVSVLHNSEWSKGKIQWELVEGDFWKSFANAPRPDLIFFDPFSFKTNPEFWIRESFDRLFDFLGNTPCWLYTYSASTRVRADLLASGFQVGFGAASGPKASTTVAMTPAARGTGFDPEFLGPEWMGRYRRSDVFCQRTEALLLQHPQFRLI
jgi:queuine tRNA-ribosyltransferase